jgi:hypothetical protein
MICAFLPRRGEIASQNRRKPMLGLAPVAADDVTQDPRRDRAPASRY